MLKPLSVLVSRPFFSTPSSMDLECRESMLTAADWASRQRTTHMITLLGLQDDIVSDEHGHAFLVEDWGEDEVIHVSSQVSTDSASAA